MLFKSSPNSCALFKKIISLSLPRPKKATNHSTLYQQLCPRKLLEVRREKAGSCYACPARLDHQQVSHERKGTKPLAICKVQHVISSHKCEVSRDAKEDDFWHQSQTLPIVLFSKRKPACAFVSPLVQLQLCSQLQRTVGGASIQH